MDVTDVVFRLTKRRTFAVVTERQGPHTHNLKGVRDGELLIYLDLVDSAGGVIVDRVGVMTKSGIRYQPVAPELSIGPSSELLLDVPWRTPGMTEMPPPTARRWWEAILEHSPETAEIIERPAKENPTPSGSTDQATPQANAFNEALKGFNVTNDVIDVLLHAAAEAQATRVPIVPSMIWAAAIQGNYSAGTVFLVALREQRPSLEFTFPDVVRDSATTRARMSEENGARIRALLEAAETLRAKTKSRQIDVDHLLGSFASGTDLAIDVDLARLRRDLARVFATLRRESLEAWQDALNVEVPFNIANRTATDIWTREDSLGYAKYAQAISDSILIGDTQPPLTIGIQAPWGQGKTSLMRMIQARLDPKSETREQRGVTNDFASAVTTTYAEFLKALRGAKADRTTGFVSSDARAIPTVWFNPLLP